jgi:DNA-binding LacI/PurR family transcriptional regulator
MKKVTLQMIADRLNVSKALVSKALSNDPTVSEVTRELIWKTAQEMNYRFKKRHKESIDPKTRNIAVLMPRAYLNDMEYWGVVIRGIDKELEKNGFSMMLSSIDISLSPKDGLPSSIYERKIDGGIVLGQMPDSYIKALVSHNVPLVMVDADYYSPAFDHVLANNFLGAYLATEKLLQEGHLKLAFVGDAETTWSFRERSRGFEEAIRYFNASSEQKAEFVHIRGVGVTGNGMYTSELLDESLRKYVIDAKDDRVTGMFCANDLCALESLKRLNQHNIKCPDDVSIIGFDNLTIAEFINPKLTTVDVPKEVIGFKAVQMLLKRLNHPGHLPEFVLIPTKLIERESVRRMT